jgi:hypothetical protein
LGEVAVERRHLALALCALVACASPPEAKPRVVWPRLELGLSCEAPRLVAGKPVPLTATATNSGTVSVEFTEIDAIEGRGDPRCLQLHATGPDGRVLENREQNDECIWIRRHRLAPGESAVYLRCDLAEVFDLSRPGRYRVWLERPWVEGDAAASNVLELDVP